MSRSARLLRRVLLPTGVFLAVVAAHYVWLGVFPEQARMPNGWATVDAPADPWFWRYVEAQDYWLGFTYALSLAFAASALRRYREERLCTARTLAIGGITLSGFLAVAGCYLLGCCGSPMLAVYLNLFGATFLPMAKPLVAGLSTITILAAWLWMNYTRRESVSRRLAPSCDNAECNHS